MAWAWVFLASSLLGGAFVLNAFRPLRHEYLLVPSFFAGWYTGEMPVWHIVWQVAATVVFALLGAFGSWPGWVGLAVAVCSWVGLGILAGIGRRAGGVLVGAEEELGFPAIEDLDLPATGSDTMWRFPRLIYPLPRPARTVKVVRNVDYAGDGARGHRLDIIRRRDEPPVAGPVLLYIHGGAWVIGDKREQGLPLLYELARRGWVTVTINYRLSPKATWPDHLVDCKRALVWVREHIADYGGDPRFIAVSGGSAGGHLCSMVALTPGDPAFQPGFEDAPTGVEACIPFYGVYDMTAGRGTDHYDRGLMSLLEHRVFKLRYDDDPRVFEAASPQCRVNPDAPPFFVVHGTNDTLVPVAEARRFVDSLRSVSAGPVVYAELPYTQHAFDVLPSVRSAHAVAAVVRFLEGVRHRPTPSTGGEDPTVLTAPPVAPAVGRPPDS
ncbi:MAG TPA: alpha/beta hydrolase [Acidimicrobiales bacterium]|nr:alpha/beta hydrolase [Acidimicrobiales bacterium]